ncbi:MAG TPA: hypothetical protein VEU33_15840, partial [Archangium sp.]|nr:hypothetical protein [Archangium sp.]
MFRLPTKIVALSLLSLSLAVTGCGGVEAEDLAPEEQAASVDHADEQDLGTTESAVCGYCDNCVLHARCL